MNRVRRPRPDSPDLRCPHHEAESYFDCALCGDDCPKCQREYRALAEERLNALLDSLQREAAHRDPYERDPKTAQMLAEELVDDDAMLLEEQMARPEPISPDQHVLWEDE